MTLRHHPGVTYVRRSRSRTSLVSPRFFASCTTCGWEGPTRDARDDAGSDAATHEERLLTQIRPGDECEGCDGCGWLVTTRTDGRVIEWECTDCGGTGRVGEGGHDV